MKASRDPSRDPHFNETRSRFALILEVLVALATAFIVSQFGFDYVEALFYDARVRLRTAPATSGHIELISVEPATVEKLGRVPNASDHIELLKNLRLAGARSVIYLINPNEIVGSFDDLEKMSAAMGELPNFYVAVPDMALKGEEDVYKLLPPFEKLRAMSAPKTIDRNIFAGDQVTRRLIVAYQGQKTLYPEVAKLFNPDVADEAKIRGLFEYLQSTQVYVDFRPAKTYPTLPFNEFIKEKPEDLGTFRDKIVIVGRDIQTTAKDYIRTPYSRDIVGMTTLEMNANMLDTLIRNSAPVRSPAWLNFIFTALISILTVHVVLGMRPTSGLLVLGSTVLTYFVFCYVMFWPLGIWISMAQPVIAIFICYYFIIPYRLIVENRRSWEYLQKNRLLTQVEELKTNFLSMMSHDLKTPIARIQGATEVVRKDPTPLSRRQHEALATVATSSQELLEFVSSILNLGRIESKEIQLNFSSRDPNGLLNEVVQKLDHLVKAKNIQVIMELEPLFSARMDVDLIRQVISNLVENAIKYSPENSRILISSEENEGRVIIQIADQGIGIPEEELGHVFDKFYRAKAAKTSPTKGSGLGLYLAKYFVELHNGTISVDSRPGVGSTFTVDLPTDPA